MAGIGFQLEKIARNGGVGGFASAAINGALVSCGPWLMTICAVLLLQIWTDGHSDLAARDVIKSVMVYSFSASVLIAAPVSMVGVRLVSDLLYKGDHEGVPSIMVTMMNWATIFALIIGYLIFGLMASLPPLVTVLAIAILVLLTQLSVIGSFLSATKRHVPILIGYIGGIAVGSAAILLFGLKALIPVLFVVALTAAVSLVVILEAIRTEFPAAPTWQPFSRADVRRMSHVALAGLASAMALWMDKWLLWWAPESSQIIGYLRVNTIYDQASFLGLLTLVPGLSVILVLSESRFERAFATFTARCTGTASLTHIKEARLEVALTILHHLRLLVAMQVVIATICWVMSAEIFRLLGFDARGVFSFRFTVVGAIFHLIVIYITLVLSYFDLFSRILMIWLAFAIASAVGTLVFWQIGFAAYGWGYLVGAIMAALCALALLGTALVKLIYLMFAGNNPSVTGDVRNWT